MNRWIPLISFLFFVTSLFGQTTFINEVNYLSAEPCIEIITPEDTDLSNWSLHLYNSAGEVIDMQPVSGPVGTVEEGLSFIIVDVVISVSASSGIALVDDNGQIIQFIAFGSSITATDGPAIGLTAENIGIQTTPASSLQLEGTGNEYTDFTWGEDISSCGLPNANQLIEAPIILPLPVELLYFKGFESRQGVQIEWKTLTEINSDYFVVESSKDGQNWKVLSHLPSAGNSQEPLLYKTIDKSPFAGENYYRLSQIDFDGKMEIFDIISVHIHADDQINIYPNPGSTDVLNIKLLKTDTYDNLEVSLIDVYGKIIFLPAIASGQFDVSFLQSGIYFLRITSEYEEYHLIYVRSEK